MIGDVIYNILSTDTTVNGLVSGRILPSGAEQTTVSPYITYSQISKIPNKTKDRNIEIQTLRIQVDMFTKTFEQVSVLADAVLNALSFYTGINSGENVDIITFEDENDLFSGQSEIFRKSQDYIIRLKY